MSNKSDKHLVLDLDDTLITSKEVNRSAVPYDYYESQSKLYVWKRPGVDKFLRWCCGRFKSVNIWSHGKETWVVNNVVQLFAREQVEEMNFIYSRDQAVMRCGGMYKDLDVLAEFGMTQDNTVAVDDQPFNYIRTPNNVVSIAPYKPYNRYVYSTESMDPELVRVQSTLQGVINCKSVSAYLRVLKASKLPDIVHNHRRVYMTIECN